jgi:uncharacterized tellurite resistance protein B-like protein
MIELDSLEDFALLLLLHMSHADGSLHPNERETILERMHEIFPSYLIEDKVVFMEASYQKLGPSRAEALLLASLDRFSVSDTAKRKQIFAALFDIINANGRVDVHETHTLQVFRAWLLS